MINLRACSALLVLLGFGAASSVDVCSNWMVAPSSCPEFTGATIKGKEDRSSAEILSGINFAGSVSFEWKASNATIALPNATRFTLSLSGDVAPPKGGAKGSRSPARFRPVISASGSRFGKTGRRPIWTYWKRNWITPTRLSPRLKPNSGMAALISLMC